MSYNDELNNISRSKVYLIKLIMDYCSLSFGIAPCSATGVQCFNTYPTCKDTANYNKTTKVYKFISSDTKTTIMDARPYVKEVQFYAQEIKEDNTVVGRVKIVMYDEKDYDIGIDPYVTQRGYTSIFDCKGTFWKKFIVRNTNYVNRLVEIYEGFEKLGESDYRLRWAGKIESITINNNLVTIECVDHLKAMKDVEHPLVKNASISQKVRAIHICHTEDAMLSLNVISDVFAKRTDYKEFIANGSPVYQSDGIYLPDTSHSYYIIAFDVYGRQFARSNLVEVLIPETGENAVSLSWNSVTNASYYRIYDVTNISHTYIQQTGTSRIVGRIVDPWVSGQMPEVAERYYYLTQFPPNNISNWVEDFSDNIRKISINGISELPNSGYILIDDEVIYYNGKSGNYVVNVERGMFKTEPKEHEGGTFIKLFLTFNPGNPFTILLNMLQNAVSANYIDTNAFNNYATSYSGINFVLSPVVKKTDFAKLYFDLVKMVRCYSYVNEDGKITIRKYNEDIGNAKVTDEANIIINTDNVTFDYDSIATRVGIYWHRLDYTEDIDEEENYKYLNVAIDSVSESGNVYGKSKPLYLKTVWIEERSKNGSYMPEDYVNQLSYDLVNDLKRPKMIVECQLEMKDSNNIRIGDTILLTTELITDIYGNNVVDKKFLVISKEINDNKIKLKLKEK